MPINGHDPSSQTAFFPRQSSLTHPYGHVFSSRAPALRAASAEPSAVRPDGLGDGRDAVSETTVLRPATPVDEERPAVRGWQDKGALGRAPQASPQPAPGTEDERRSVSDTGSDRSHDSTDDLRRSARLTLWVRPGVKTALARLAKDDNLSLSETAATGLEVYARAKIHDQEEALFEPRMRAMMRREIRASDNRHIYFEMRNAIAAEQTRILITDLYKRQLRKEGMPLREINMKLDNTYNMARDNILRKTKTPQLKNLLDAWWRSTEDLPDLQTDQADGSQEQNAGRGEAGKAKPEA